MKARGKDWRDVYGKFISRWLFLGLGEYFLS